MDNQFISVLIICRHAALRELATSTQSCWHCICLPRSQPNTLGKTKKYYNLENCDGILVMTTLEWWGYEVIKEFQRCLAILTQHRISVMRAALCWYAGCSMLHHAAWLVCRLLQTACRIYMLYMQTAAGITRMHTVAFWKMHMVSETLQDHYHTAYVIIVMETYWTKCMLLAQISFIMADTNIETVVVDGAI